MKAAHVGFMSHLTDFDLDNIISGLMKLDTVEAKSLRYDALLEWFTRHPDMLPPCYEQTVFPDDYGGVRDVYKWPCA